MSHPQLAPTRLRHGAKRLFGRESEIAILDEAWNNSGKHILSVVAWGGAGKTSLVLEWMNRRASTGWRGIERVFEWSFYSQGIREQGSVSADNFIEEALKFFGDTNSADSTRSPWEKGARLAQIVTEKPTLLVLDGVEPLQHSGTGLSGRFSDPAMEMLLKGLARKNNGLCIVTSRQPLTDLAAFRDTTAPTLLLQRLPLIASVEMLKELGAKGTQSEIENLVETVKGHALTLYLLGKFLALAYNGEVRNCDRVGLHNADEEISGGHAFRVIEAYERWFAAEGMRGRKQLAVLQLLGLFDGPASTSLVSVLLKRPAIPGLTEPVMAMSSVEYNTILGKLRECGLVSIDVDSSGTTSRIDSHPLIREYFGRKLKNENCAAWRKAHARLFRHIKDTTTDLPRPTLDDLLPLYQAIWHGCQAELQTQACVDVYKRRILRESEFYSIKMLGAVGSDLAAASCFYDQRWGRVSPRVPPVLRSWLLSQTSSSLQSLCRFSEAIDLEEQAVSTAENLGDWSNASRACTNLSGMYLRVGLPRKAAERARQGIDYGLRARRSDCHLFALAALGSALHHEGLSAEASALFQEAEAIQAQCEPHLPILYSVRGFHHRELLLAPIERAAWNIQLRSRLANTSKVQSADTMLQDGSVCDEVIGRGMRSLEWISRSGLLLSQALDNLSIGRAALYACALKGAIEGTNGDLARTRLNMALDGFRKASAQDFVPQSLVSKSWIEFLSGKADAASDDLDYAFEIAERSGMRLQMADIELYRARLFRSRESLVRARQIIDSSGYGRRKDELADAEELARSWP